MSRNAAGSSSDVASVVRPAATSSANSSSEPASQPGSWSTQDRSSRSRRRSPVKPPSTAGRPPSKSEPCSPISVMSRPYVARPTTTGCSTAKSVQTGGGEQVGGDRLVEVRRHVVVERHRHGDLALLLADEQ